MVLLRTKGVVLDSLLEDEAVTRARRDPEVREMMENRRLLWRNSGRPKEEDVPRAPIFRIPRRPSPIGKKLELEEQQLEAGLADKGVGSGKTRRCAPATCDVSDVREALPGDAALVEFVAYNRYAGRLGSEPAYGAVVLTTRRAPLTSG